MRLNLPDVLFSVDERDDSGRRVEINSTGGFFEKEQGTVVYGPFQYPYTVRTKLPRKNGEIQKYREEKKVSAIQYYVLVDRWKRIFSFLDSEITLL